MRTTAAMAAATMAARPTISRLAMVEALQRPERLFAFRQPSTGRFFRQPSTFQRKWLYLFRSSFFFNFSILPFH
mgnify:CR=1 FL=1